LFLESLKQRQIHSDLWRIAVPLILSNLSVPLLGIVDTAVVGHLDSPHYIGAVAVGSMIFGIVFWGFGFLRMGTTAFTAQAFGAGDGDEIRAVLLRALFLAMVFSLLLIGLQQAIAWLAFQLIGAGEQVEQQARLYFFIRILSAPATLANYVLLGWFLGLHNARAPLLLLLFVNSLNMALDFVFVTVLGTAADGVAWASFIAEYCGLGLGLLLLRGELRKHPGHWHMQRILDRTRLLHLLAVNRDIFIRTLCLMFTLAFFTAQGSRLGDAVLAANAVLFTFQTFMAYGLDGLAHAAEAMTGKAVGASNQRQFDAVLVVTLCWALAASSVFAWMYFALGEIFIAWISDIESVRHLAANYLPWVALLPLISVWSFILDGIYIGATKAAEMRNTMLFSTVCVFLPAWYLLQTHHNHGLWLAFCLFMLARAVSMGLLFLLMQRQNRLFPGITPTK